MKSDNILSKAIKDQRFLLALVIFGIIIIIASINPKFIAITNLITVFQQISVLGILTMAMSILLISGGIDLSIGNIMVLSGIIISKSLSSGISFFPALAAGCITGILAGFLNGIIIAKTKCIPLIITLGTAQIFYGISLTISSGRIMSFYGALNGLKHKFFSIFPAMLLVLFVMTVSAYILMNKTKFGRRVVAIGGNEKNAFLSGINVTSYKIAVYTLAGFFSAIAGIVFAARIDSITANAGGGYETNALTAAIIGGVTFDGGKGTIPGTFLGCLLMGVISNAMNILRVPTYIQTIITGCIIVCAVILSNINNLRKNN
ncbi:ABC transporter permease [Treponema lecithinolyticum]|jgi:Ribose/xylose/arabinose/galactoside ABC-type transport systems, permease components|uniref:ABC transporter permease n=2 Tax=Treponema lecithinolyticum TaxID=53418 RepID=UPI0028E52EC2|nr:ABC transporter permease [Treponema lecithinolyticum]